MPLAFRDVRVGLNDATDDPWVRTLPAWEPRKGYFVCAAKASERDSPLIVQPTLTLTPSSHEGFGGNARKSSWAKAGSRSTPVSRRRSHSGSGWPFVSGAKGQTIPSRKIEHMVTPA